MPTGIRRKNHSDKFKAKVAIEAAKALRGEPHGPHKAVATCQTYMRSFSDGDLITVEPFRAKPFPIIKDLVVYRQSFDKIMQSGGFISVRTGAAQDANAIPIEKATGLVTEAKKSLPLSSTTMNAGKSSTSIFQTASIPSSGYSSTSTDLMQSCASRAAGPPMEPR